MKSCNQSWCDKHCVRTSSFFEWKEDVKTLKPVQKNQTVIDSISKINLRNKAISISTFDFSTLYTYIPH